MKERPIIFSAPMVRAILDGSKTQTRLVMKPQPINGWEFESPPVFGRITSPHPKRDRFGIFVKRGGSTDFPETDLLPCPYGQPGDRLYVRETWRHTASDLEEARALTEDITSGTAVDYRATYIETCKRELGFSQEDAEMSDSFEHWRPSIHMPRWASRILLEITAVRVERLNDISEVDAKAEGIRRVDVAFAGDKRRDMDTQKHPPVRFADAFCDLWEDINGAGSWAANPWVWIVEFKRVEGGAA